MFYSVATVPEAEVDMPVTNNSEQSEPTPDAPQEKKTEEQSYKIADQSVLT